MHKLFITTLSSFAINLAVAEAQNKQPVTLVIGPARYAIRVNSVQSSETASSAGSDSRCKQWRLDSMSVLKIICNAKPMGANEWDARFAVLPCEMSGTLTADGKRYTYHINAGAYMIITDGRENYFYNCAAKSCSSLFLKLPYGFSKEDQ